MTIRKRTKGERISGFEPCANNCRSFSSSNDLGRSVATHVAVILDRETPLCGKCAREWRRIWDGALEREPEAVAA